jgi:hypothetical protein
MIYWKPTMGTALVNVLPTNNSTNQIEQVRGKGANMFCYSNRYRDLYNAFDAPHGPGNNSGALMAHYNAYGKNEGRKVDC